MSGGYYLSLADYHELSRLAAPSLASWLQRRGLPVRRSNGRITIGKDSGSGRLSFHAWYVYENSGSWIDAANGDRGGVVQLIERVCGCDRRMAIDTACELAGWQPEGVRRRQLRGRAS